MTFHCEDEDDNFGGKIFVLFLALLDPIIKSS